MQLQSSRPKSNDAQRSRGSKILVLAIEEILFPSLYATGDDVESFSITMVALSMQGAMVSVDAKQECSWRYPSSYLYMSLN